MRVPRSTPTVALVSPWFDPELTRRADRWGLAADRALIRSRARDRFASYAGLLGRRLAETWRGRGLVVHHFIGFFPHAPWPEDLHPHTFDVINLPGAADRNRYDAIVYVIDDHPASQFSLTYLARLGGLAWLLDPEFHQGRRIHALRTDRLDQYLAELVWCHGARGLAFGCDPIEESPPSLARRLTMARLVTALADQTALPSAGGLEMLRRQGLGPSIDVVPLPRLEVGPPRREGGVGGAPRQDRPVIGLLADRSVDWPLAVARRLRAAFRRSRADVGFQLLGHVVPRLVDLPDPGDDVVPREVLALGGVAGRIDLAVLGPQASSSARRLWAYHLHDLGIPCLLPPAPETMDLPEEIFPSYLPTPAGLAALAGRVAALLLEGRVGGALGAPGWAPPEVEEVGAMVLEQARRCAADRGARRRSCPSPLLRGLFLGGREQLDELVRAVAVAAGVSYDLVAELVGDLA